MKALVFTAPGQVELLDVPEPDPAPGEALRQARGAGGAVGGRPDGRPVEVALLGLGVSRSGCIWVRLVP